MRRTEIKAKAARRLRRRRHIRKQVRGVASRPRLTVYRSLTNIYAQVIDDDAGHTIVAASTRDKGTRDGLKGTGNCESAKKVGQALAEKAKAAGVTSVVFDRNGFRFHGRVKALADGAREGGLEF